jgi:hypothetical protein
MRAAQIKHVHMFRAVIAPAAAFEGQLRLARSAPAVSASAPTPRLHRYVVHHYTGIFNGATTDPAVYFSQDQQAQRLAEHQHRAQAELRRHALAAHQVQPRQYRPPAPSGSRTQLATDSEAPLAAAMQLTSRQARAKHSPAQPAW